MRLRVRSCWEATARSHIEDVGDYELAETFGVNRKTVAIRLKKAGVTMRGSPPTRDQIDEMVRLYESGLSLATVAKKVGTSPQTVRRYVHERELRMRDTHGRS